jgi:hypothetical protein
MSPSTTFIPSAAQRRANALPMPLPAPVMTAVLPAKSFIAVISSSSCELDPDAVLTGAAMSRGWWPAAGR